MKIFILIALTTLASSLAHADADTRNLKTELDRAHMVTAEEGAFEPRSIGSYTLRIYKVDNPKFPTDDFLCGLIRPRDGSLESLICEDVDGDGKTDIVVTTRCAGSRSTLTADLYMFADKKLRPVCSAKDLEKATDPVAALKLQIMKDAS